MKNDELYIGWMEKAPQSFVRFLKKYLVLLAPLALILGVLLALSQKKFGTGNFEFGQLTELKGFYCSGPVPCIRVISAKDSWGNPSCLTIPLVGYGKHGADGIIADIENERKVSLDRKEITLRGTLLYNDGKTFLQIDKNDHPLVAVSGGTVGPDMLPRITDLGVRTVRGEIVDAKCYFGVMKPGEGRPHQDCAIRCILGGIPPVMLVRNDAGETNYYLIVGPNGEKMNQQVKDLVAIPVSLKARLVRYDDWIVAYVQDPGKIGRISYLRMKYGDKISHCSGNCMK